MPLNMDDLGVPLFLGKSPICAVLILLPCDSPVSSPCAILYIGHRCVAVGLLILDGVIWFGLVVMVVAG